MQGDLQGAWVPVAARVGEQSLMVGDLRVKYLMVEGGGYSIIDSSNQVVDRGTVRIDAGTVPSSMDLIGSTGPNAGRTMLAVYALSADRLTVCYSLEGGERPRCMQARADELLLSITYERARIALS